MAKVSKSLKSASSKAENEPIKYRLKEISIDSFAIQDLSRYSRNANREAEIRSWDFEYNMKITYDESTKPPEITVSVVTSLSWKNQELATLSSHVLFDITGVNTKESIEKDGLPIPKQLQVSLIGSSIGTIRGILWTKLQGTKISHVLLPLVNPKELSEKMVYPPEANN